MKRTALIFCICIIMCVQVCILSACGRGGDVEFDPSLDVIVDQNQNNKINMLNINIKVNYDSAVGRVSYGGSSDVYSFVAEPVNGYSFIGWYADDGINGSLISNKISFSINSTDVGKYLEGNNLTIHARFARKYSIAYNLNGGMFVGADAADHYIVSDEDQLLANNVSKPGYRFAGWRSSLTGQTLNEIPAQMTGDVVFSAVWEKLNSESNKYRDTVWELQFDGESYAALIFNADGTLDVFSFDSTTDVPYINCGAALNMQYDFYSNFFGQEYVYSSDLKKVTYDCTRSYYIYELIDGGCEIKLADGFAFDSSVFYDLYSLILGDFRYYLVENSDGTIEFQVKAATSITFNGKKYNSDDFAELLSTRLDNLPDQSQISYEYDIMKSGWYFTMVENRVTDYKFTAFSSKDTLTRSVDLGYDIALEGVNFALSKIDGSSYAYAGVAFEKNGEIYTGHTQFYLVDLEFFRGYQYEDTDVENIEKPFKIKLAVGEI